MDKTAQKYIVFFCKIPYLLRLIHSGKMIRCIRLGGEKMKALRFSNFGDVSVLHVEELPTPVPGPDEVLVEVHAASINPSDAKNVQGKMKQISLPRIPGQDFAGVIVAGGKKRMGQEVWGTGGDVGFTRDGSHAEFIAVPERGARPKPKSLSMIEAASVGRNYVVAFFGLIQKAKLEEGETVLVTGASGGVGSSVIKIAKSRAARVIALYRQTPDPERTSRLGIDLALSTESDDIVNQVKQFTRGQGVDVAYDCVGGALFEMALNTLGPGGRQVNIAAVGERRVSFDLLDFYRRQITLFGVNTITMDTIASGDILDDLRDAFEQGRLTPPEIARTCLLEDAVEAYRQVDSGAAGGKIVFTFPH
jgi:NADPH:quinone reductase-like Zn-dependent oxidoreductase